MKKLNKEVGEKIDDFTKFLTYEGIFPSITNEDKTAIIKFLNYAFFVEKAGLDDMLRVYHNKIR